MIWFFVIDEIQIKFMIKIQMIFTLIDDSAFLTKSLKVHPRPSYVLNHQI